MTLEKTIVTGLSAAGLVLAGCLAYAASQYGPGVSDTEIKIGNTVPYSGPASALGSLGKAEAAYFAMINEQGGINGRKINNRDERVGSRPDFDKRIGFRSRPIQSRSQRYRDQNRQHHAV